MLDALKTWIISVVTTVIFVTVVEIILPEGSIKKYVKLATGLLVMIAVLSPIFKIISSNVNLSEKISSYTSSIASTNKVDIEKANEDFKKKTKEAFKNTLKENIEKDIKEKTGKAYSVVNIQLKKEKNELDFAAVDNIEVRKLSDNNKVVPVDKVQIGENSNIKEEVQREKDVLKVLENDFNIKNTDVKFVK